MWPVTYSLGITRNNVFTDIVSISSLSPSHIPSFSFSLERRRARILVEYHRALFPLILFCKRSSASETLYICISNIMITAVHLEPCSFLGYYSSDKHQHSPISKGISLRWYGAIHSLSCAFQFECTNRVYLWQFVILMVLKHCLVWILWISRTVEQGKCAKNSIKTCKESVVLVILGIHSLVLLLYFTSIARASASNIVVYHYFVLSF